MILILLLSFSTAIFVLLSTRFTLISVFIVSSCVYCLPAFWLAGVPDIVALSWCLVFLTAVIGQLTHGRSYRAAHAGEGLLQNVRSARITNFTFNYITIGLFLLLIYLSDGVTIFFRGKYSGVAAHTLVYYSWNSLLLITAIHNLYSRRFLTLFSIFAIAQIFLLFVAGDRTIPILFLAAVMYHYLRGATPLALPKRARMLMFASPFILPLALVSKSLYTVLPQHGFTAQTAELVGRNFSDWAVKDFEPSHTMVMFNAIAAHGLPYHWSDLIRGLPAILPFSTYMGVNAHLFSQVVKARYFPSWGPAAGVGANFWAEGYAVQGLAGVVAFAVIVIFTLRYLERAIGRTQSSAVRATLLACGVILAFYVHRNSVEQILAFLGRYATLGILVGLLARFALNSTRSRDQLAEPPSVARLGGFGLQSGPPNGSGVKRHG